ncbi:hypothetical protein [Antarcticirhabdus aurantiaca]|uniref:Uncharacterized protein n=1 Tax=Antarcticirhabdus aurantiaca TaxID=2606717 RepID=A0ACD4NSS2_9HYPH|nr:hypothetical protein [Antarcticirhabdus aurantiaca]WAJ29933.1 hypothetical protein OXU80_06885 [Jeongeuplla avenae]
MQEFVAALVSFFLIQPLEAEIRDRFGDVSREQVAAITECVGEAAPILVQQTFDDPWRTATQVFVIWTGMTPAEQILAETTPLCADAFSMSAGAEEADA